MYILNETHCHGGFATYYYENDPNIIIQYNRYELAYQFLNKSSGVIYAKFDPNSALQKCQADISVIRKYNDIFWWLT